jgi:hypothetical protein
MKGFVQGADRQQTTLLPECLDDWVGESNTRITPGCVQFLGEENVLTRPGSISTELGLSGHVRSTPDSDRIADVPDRQLRAKSRPKHLLNLARHLGRS